MSKFTGLVVKIPDNLSGYINTTLTRHGFDVEQGYAAVVEEESADWAAVRFTQGDTTMLINFALSVLLYQHDGVWTSYNDMVKEPD